LTNRTDGAPPVKRPPAESPEAFFRALFDPILGDLPPFFHLAHGTPKPVRGESYRRLEDFRAAILDAVERGRDVYFASDVLRANASGSAGRAVAGDFRAALGVRVDLDAKDEGIDLRDEHALAAWKARALRRLLEEIPLPPSAVVDSGNGLHAYFLLREPLEDPEEARALHLLAAAALGGDRAVADPCDLLRAPGSVNRKPDLPARPCRVLFLDATRRFNLGEIREALEPLAEARGKAIPRAHVAAGKTRPIRPLAERGPASVPLRRLLTRWADPEEDGRSRWIVSVCAEAYRLGWAETEALDALLAGTARLRERGDAERAGAWEICLAREVSSIFGKLARGEIGERAPRTLAEASSLVRRETPAPVEESAGATLEEVRARIEADALAWARGEGPARLLIESAPGVGKTYLDFRAIFRAWNENPAHRYAYATETRRLLEDAEREARKAAASLGISASPLAVFHGRDSDNCRNLETVELLGEGRHAQLPYCRSGACPFAEGCRYLAQRARAEAAPIILLTTDGARTNPDLLEGRRLVVDEDALRFVREEGRISGADLSSAASAALEWGGAAARDSNIVRAALERARALAQEGKREEAARHYPDVEKARAFFAAVAAVLPLLRENLAPNTLPARLAAAARAQLPPEVLSDIEGGIVRPMEEVRSFARGLSVRRARAFAWEQGDPAKPETWPPRVGDDLLEILGAALRGERIAAQTLGEALEWSRRSRAFDRVEAILWLSATPPSKPLPERLGFERRSYSLPLPEGTHVVAVADRLFGVKKDDRPNEDLVVFAGGVRDARERRGARAAIFVRKREGDILRSLGEDIAGDVAHFGNETKAVNRFAGREVYIVGRFCLPPEALAFEAATWRALLGEDFLAPKPEAQAGEDLLGFGGTTWYAKVPRLPDPLETVLLRHAHDSAIRQAIGRARGPALFYILDGWPLAGLRYDEVLSLDEAAAREGISLPAVSAQYASLYAENLRREAAAEALREKVEAYLVEHPEASARKASAALGRSPTDKTVHRLVVEVRGVVGRPIEKERRETPALALGPSTTPSPPVPARLFDEAGEVAQLEEDLLEAAAASVGEVREVGRHGAAVAEVLRSFSEIGSGLTFPLGKPPPRDAKAA
jgi:hypothetical protein